MVMLPVGGTLDGWQDEGAKAWRGICRAWLGGEVGDEPVGVRKTWIVELACQWQLIG
jgi:hypothetical protein